MTFECEGGAIQLRNLDTTPFMYVIDKKSAASIGGLPLLPSVSYRGTDPLIATNLVSYPITCVIDRYIHVYVR